MLYENDYDVSRRRSGGKWNNYTYKRYSNTDKLIEASALSGAVDHILSDYNATVVAGVKDKAKASIKKLVKETKKTAPKRTGRYRSNITSKELYSNSLGASYLWYVKGSSYRLSHLLEHGHATRDGGRTKAYEFIKKATDPILKEYVEAIEEVIKNG